MANKTLKGLFQNNRRRETNAVTLTVPAVLNTADLREGTAADLVVPGDVYSLIDLPAGIVITEMCVVVTDVMDSGATLKADITDGTTTTVIVAAAALDAEGLTKAATTDPVLLTAKSTVEAVVTGAVTKGSVQIVISYIDYSRATMSYIGED